MAQFELLNENQKMHVLPITTNLSFWIAENTYSLIKSFD